MRLVLGTRGSDLARTQTAMVEAALWAHQPELELAREIIRTSGDEKPGMEPTDRRQGLKGMFTGELERALREGRIDVAVHSAKDLPSEHADGLEIAAVLPRAAVEDVLVTKKEGPLEALPRGATVATGSVRRQHQLRWLRPDLNVVALRGNVPTRLRRLAENDWNGIILARAGLQRLGFDLAGGRLQEFCASVLPMENFLPAGGQGIIALQIRANDTMARELVGSVNKESTHWCLRVEREFLRLLEGDCGTPVGVHATKDGSRATVRAQVFVEGETAPREGTIESEDSSPERIAAALFAKMYEQER